MTSRAAQAAGQFQSLHDGPGAFVLANAWDAGSARVLAGLGFPAVATSSGAFAGTLGRKDGRVSRDEALEHSRAVVAAVELPVSADLENGFGDAPEFIAETVRLAADTGLAGCSIEDARPERDRPLYDRDAACERIAASAEAVAGLGRPFVLTARAENFIRGNPDLDDTIARLVAFEAAGADVLMAPGLPDLNAVRAVCEALSKPFSFMVGIPKRSFSKAELEAAGVRRISLATSLYRAAMSGLVDAARQAQDGDFSYVDRGLPSVELNAFMQS